MSPHDLNQRLSRHFTLREAVKSNVAMRHGIDNTPSLELIPAMVRVTDTESTKEWVFPIMVLMDDPEISDGEESKWSLSFEGSRAEPA